MNAIKYNNIIMVFNKNLHKFQDKVYDIIVYITWILYIAIALGISVNAPQYLDDLQYYIKLYVSIFLIYRFNPFRRVKFTGLDAKIAFSAGVFLLATTAINSIINDYLLDFKKYLTSYKNS
jgi:hypothetical protein